MYVFVCTVQFLAAAGLRLTRLCRSQSENKLSSILSSRKRTTVPLTSPSAISQACAHTNTYVHLLTSADFPSSAGCWLKSEETVAMKTKRADFAAAFLRGRMIIAGGLGERVTLWSKLSVYCFHSAVYIDFTAFLLCNSCQSKSDKSRFSDDLMYLTANSSCS